MNSRARYVLIAVILAVAGLLFVSSGRTQDEGQIAVPRMVAQVALKGQTDAIPLTPIFTPHRDGLFRVSGYLETAPSIASGGVGLQVFWQDDFSASPPGGGGNANLGGFVQFSGGDSSSTGANNVVFLRAKANTAVSFFTSGDFPCNASCQYNVFITIEQMPDTVSGN